MGKRLLIVVPAYNEAEHIQEVLSDIKRYATPQDEILVVNDGSTDITEEIVKTNKVTLISHKRNKGKGAAIRTGISYFLMHDFKYVIFIDADGQHNPKHIPIFIHYFEMTDVDVILANRFATSTWKSNMPFTRKLSNLLSRFGLWILFNRLFIPDPQNGYRGFRREVLQNLTVYSNRYEAETEMIIDCFLNNYKFGFLGIESIYQPYHRSSKFSLIYDTWTIPSIMIKKFFAEKPWLRKQLK